MKYLSVCSGIEAASVAWQPLHWSAVGFSEIEKFPGAVLAHHYPDIPNYGDMNDFKKWPETSIDVLVGGTPCQSFSVAGLRAGMADPRGNLALVYLAIAQRYRPTWLVWENVPGVLSSDEGRDFGAIVGAMVKLGYGIAYRVLDAQYFGVPQRRRRVFVIGYLGGWRRAAEVLFEPASLLRNSAPSREAGQRATYDVAPSITASGRGTERTGESRGQDCVIPEIAAPLLSGVPNGGPGHGARSGHAKDATLIPEIANPLTARMHKGINTTCDEGQTAIVTHSLCGEGFDASEDGTGRGTPLIAEQMTVRRLTPLECEHLQGFPDGYTDIPGASDSGRYKALGNSMAVPVMRWIGERIASTGAKQ